MMEKSKRRKRDEGKDTVYSFGGKVWDYKRIENTLSRTQQKVEVNEDLAGMLAQLRAQIRRFQFSSILEPEAD